MITALASATLVMGFALVVLRGASARRRSQDVGYILDSLDLSRKLMTEIAAACSPAPTVRPLLSDLKSRVAQESWTNLVTLSAVKGYAGSPRNLDFGPEMWEEIAGQIRGDVFFPLKVQGANPHVIRRMVKKSYSSGLRDAERELALWPVEKIAPTVH